jgi:tape measure domain-containing protein
MQKVGVEAVVEGLAGFIRDTGKINDALAGIQPQGTLLQRVVGGVGAAFGSLGREILNVAEVALGTLLAHSVEFAIEKVKELIGVVVEAANEFQTMQLRLDRLNFNSLIESGKSFTEALTESRDMTKDQLDWIRKLAIQTPYDAQDVAHVFTLAQSYGFAADESKHLTENITDFAAGMGLGNTEIQRIIVNFGQMVQQGKVTQREMNDLARGAFVPVNDVLERMQENVGLTGAAFDDFRTSGEGVTAFMGAFSEIVEERFQGAAKDMSRTFQGATDNALDFVKSVLGFDVVLPVLEKIGGKIADMLEGLTSETNFKLITDHASRFGQALAGMLEDVLGLGDFDADTLVEGIVTGFDKMTTWINTHGKDVKQFFIDVGQSIQEKVVPFIEDLVENFNTITDWVGENGTLIKDFFSTLGQIIAEVFGFDISSFGSLEGFLEIIKAFMQYVIDNKDAISDWASKLMAFFLIWQVGATILSVVGTIIVGLIGFVLGLVGAVFSVVSIMAVFGITVGAVTTFLGTFIATVVILLGTLVLITGVAAIVFAAWLLMRNGGELLKASIITVVTAIREQFEVLKRLAKETATKIMEAIKNNDWAGVGRAVVDGVIAGIKSNASKLMATLVKLAKDALKAAMNALGIKSPSKEFEMVGEMTIKGLVEGIMNNARLAREAMKDAVQQMSAPAMALPNIMQQYAVAAGPSVSTSYQNTNNWNLTVHSNAQHEQVVADYNMMQSLAGA